MESKTRPLLWCLLALAGCGMPALCDDRRQQVDGPLPWHVQDDDVFLRRIVSAATAEPIPNATVRLYAEVPHPVPGTRSPTAIGRSDANGWVRIRRGELEPSLFQQYGDPSWAYVEAPGYGPNAAFGGDRLESQKDLELRPATEVRVTLQDPIGRPIAGAQVGWLLGCGHTPDVRQAMTDETGTARLRDVQDDGFGQIWPVKVGLKSWYVTDYLWRPWDRPQTAELEWGTSVRGRILQHDGTPAAGVAVGSPVGHRGPWALTDERGHFLLLGTTLEPGDSFLVEAFEYPVTSDGPPHEGLRYKKPLSGHEVVITLPASGEEPRKEAKATLAIDVSLDGWHDDERADVGFAIVACRLHDGWTVAGFAERLEDATIEVPPGTYEIEVRAVQSDDTVCARARARAVVSDAGGRTQVVLPRPVAIALTHPGSDATLRLFVEQEEYVVEEESGEQVILVPRTDSVFLRIDQPGRKRIVPIDATRGGQEEPSRLVVPLAERLTVQARLTNEAGQPVEGWLAEVEAGRWVVDDEFQQRRAGAERPSTEALSGTDVAFVAWPKDPVRYQPVLVDAAMLQANGSKLVDLGVVRIPNRRPHLQVVGPSGEALADTVVTVTLGQRQEQLSTEALDGGLVFDPWAAPGLIVEGAVARTDAFGMPFVQTLSGPGPWTLRPPAGQLTVTLGLEGVAEHISFDVRVDGRHFRGQGATLVVGALAGGEHEAIVEVPGHPPRRWVFTLIEGEAKSWHVQFP